MADQTKAEGEKEEKGADFPADELKSNSTCGAPWQPK